MPAIDMCDDQSTSGDRSCTADSSSSKPQTTRRPRPKACQCCRARKIRCKAASDGSPDAICCASPTRHNNKNNPSLKLQIQKSERKPKYRKDCSKPREESHELPPEALEGLNALLHISTITPNERRLLSAFLPPKPSTQLDLNAVMRGQVIPNRQD